jgi:hypothetical protein
MNLADTVEWFQIADEDLGMAKILNGAYTRYYDLT